jgi:hypothetical protein
MSPLGGSLTRASNARWTAHYFGTSRAPHNDWIPLPPADPPRPSAAVVRSGLARLSLCERQAGVAASFGRFEARRAPALRGSLRIGPRRSDRAAGGKYISSSAPTGLCCQQARRTQAELMVPQTWRQPSSCDATTRTGSHRYPSADARGIERRLSVPTRASARAVNEALVPTCLPVHCLKPSRIDRSTS